jgi:hypothetical protein
MKRVGAGALLGGGLLFVAVALSGNNHYAGITQAKPNGEDFVVSSPGDAGPGSLRDAILAADRLSEKARIVIVSRSITIESALPALVNPHGISIEAGPQAGIIDAARQSKGATLQINSPSSTLRGLSIVNAREIAIVVAAPAAELDTVTVSNSKTGILLGAAARGCVIRKSFFEHDDTAITAETGVRDVTVVDSVFRANTRAGFWFVGAPDNTAGSSAAPDKGETSPTYSVRLVGDTFEKNAAGVVVANRPTLIQAGHFTGNQESAIMILSGAARIQDNDIRASAGTAISVTDGNAVWVMHNVLDANRASAIMVRDSQATIEGNKIQENAFGIVTISNRTSDTVIRDNWLSMNSADAITVIGGSPQVLHNQMLSNGGAGLRILDLVTAQGGLKATPHLDANVFKDNRIDMPPAGTYKLANANAP